MCGIVALSLSPRSKIPVRQLMHELLLHSEERGKVAGGYAFIKSGELTYHKEARPGGHIALKSFDKQVRLAIGHTRNATMGDPSNNDNNHPVVDSSGEIALVHNGVVMNAPAIKEGLNKEKAEDQRETFAEVDSSVLPALVRDYGFNGLTNVDGWASVAWLDKQAGNKLMLARTTDKAPLILVGLKDGSLIMGSTFQIIHAALIRVGYGDQVRWSLEVAPWTYLQVSNGQVDAMMNINPFSYNAARWKGGRITGYTEADLRKITEGTSTKTPVKSSTTSYTPSTYQPPLPTPSYTAPKKPMVVSTPPKTAPERKPVKPGENPLKAITPFAKNTGETKPSTYTPPKSTGTTVWRKGVGVPASPKSGVGSAYTSLTFQETQEALRVPDELADSLLFFHGEIDSNRGPGVWFQFGADSFTSQDRFVDWLDFMTQGYIDTWVDCYGVVAWDGSCIELTEETVPDIIGMLMEVAADMEDKKVRRTDLVAKHDPWPKRYSPYDKAKDTSADPQPGGELAVAPQIDDDLNSDNYQTVNDYLLSQADAEDLAKLYQGGGEIW